ncbi:MAG TPA: thioredoxin domain-containing protein, partial [Chloroflexia bacterium]|nr:thioredoxin domain-containing protein [Chloroflexia bacterium]
MPNRLIHETSPYLLQHAHNPVDWYPWGPEALARARTEDRPILLSIGYSACHWCHVMEHESFEDEGTADLMNQHFVPIKVDREERPDLDSIYMAAVQSLTGHGGWPMTVFLTPEGKPFFAGTYFPREDRHGLPGFQRVLESVARAYREQHADIVRSADELTEFLGDRGNMPARPEALEAGVLDRASAALAREFDSRFGGLGGAPKFPQAMAWEFLIRQYHRTRDARRLMMIETTLRGMANGGIYDQLGGGFARYSVDNRWLVPHFEKMLYDNALLSQLYLHAYQLTGEPFYRRIVEEVLDYVVREMTSSEGAFYSTQDADSEGEEGKFYVWTPAEIDAALPPDQARVARAYWGVTDAGNFEGHNILNVPRPADAVAQELGLPIDEVLGLLAAARRTLYDLRERRVHPGRDEKVLVSWNGLMLRSFAEAARVLDRADYRQVAQRNATFILEHMRDGDRLLRTYKDGRAHLAGVLEDYAFYADGLLALYEADFDPAWFAAARGLADSMIARFADAQGGGFFDTASDSETLITRPKDLLESAIPSGNSVAAEVLLRLHFYTMEEGYYDQAKGTLEAAGALLAQYASGVGRMLCALDLYLAE